MLNRVFPLVLLLLFMLAPRAARGGDIPFDQVSDAERGLVNTLLDDPDWPFRVFGILRLEHYTPDSIAEHVTAKLTDPAWQVRSFALRHCARSGIEVDPALFAREGEPRVVRALLRYGIPFDSEGITRGVRILDRRRTPDDAVLAAELLTASSDERHRTEARKRLIELLKRVDAPAAARYGRRLGVMLDLDDVPATADDWAGWRSRQTSFELPPLDAWLTREIAAPPSPIATCDFDTFGRLRDYLDALRGRRLDLVIVMDFTYSMKPMIDAARAGTDELILFLNDISGAMRLAFVAYRDHDNKPVWEGHPFTRELAPIREFLFRAAITGGQDYPEAVLDGLAACQELDWDPGAVKETVLVGDAPPHDEDLSDLAALLERFRGAGVVVHTVHVPMTANPEQTSRMSRAEIQAFERFLVDYNAGTAERFSQIAEMAGGQKTELTDPAGLVPSIMHFTIEEGWWSVFDAFYELYLSLCR